MVDVRSSDVLHPGRFEIEAVAWRGIVMTFGLRAGVRFQHPECGRRFAPDLCINRAGELQANHGTGPDRLDQHRGRPVIMQTHSPRFSLTVGRK